MSTARPHGLNTEVLIIGAGGAGLRAAIAAREAGAEVLVASKMPRDAPNCTVRTAGYFSFATEDSADELFRQVVHVGGFLNNQKLAQIFASETVTAMPKLAEYGVELEVIPTEGRERGLPGHQVLKNAPKGALGYGLTRPMRQVAEEQRVRFLDEAMAVRLIVADDCCTRW